MPSEETSTDVKYRALLSELVRGATETFKNAEELFREASLLKENGATSRALFLHQISMEECAKVDLLGNWAISMLMGYEVNISKLAAVLTSHKAKNRTNAYMLDPNDEELHAQKRADWKGVIEAFSKHQEKFHLESNSVKNASLYVDFKDGKFVTPSERITLEMVSEISSKNEDFLKIKYLQLKVLLGLEKDPDGIREVLIQFKRRVEQLKFKLPNDPKKAMEVLMQEMHEEISAKRDRDKT